MGSSPEPMVRLRDGVVTSRPIAGTRRRGGTAAEDEHLAAELAEHPKELAEHVMLVDLARNDVGRVVRFGTEHVDEFMTLERYSHVMHLTSQVSGSLAPGKGPVDVLRATLPAGTLSGAPKVRAMQIIDDLEPTKRGVYGGVVGYIDFSGNLDTAIAIRTMVVSPDGPGLGPGRRRHRRRQRPGRRRGRSASTRRPPCWPPFRRRAGPRRRAEVAAHRRRRQDEPRSDRHPRPRLRGAPSRGGGRRPRP